MKNVETFFLGGCYKGINLPKNVIGSLEELMHTLKNTTKCCLLNLSLTKKQTLKYPKETVNN